MTIPIQKKVKRHGTAASFVNCSSGNQKNSRDVSHKRNDHNLNHNQVQDMVGRSGRQVFVRDKGLARKKGEKCQYNDISNLNK